MPIPNGMPGMPPMGMIPRESFSTISYLFTNPSKAPGGRGMPIPFPGPNGAPMPPFPPMGMPGLPGMPPPNFQFPNGAPMPPFPPGNFPPPGSFPPPNMNGGDRK